eukprot:TRINITY_DN2927_c0_g6_i1.p1 TRINITY_DN2927_c0_g6~~TRINITY_DN2927_c0_g6_i1.p1  ORF type:complete len:424 (-),score=93.29 TRINITY_DN2927_c0_g6_i1:42-1211(-)
MKGRQTLFLLFIFLAFLPFCSSTCPCSNTTLCLPLSSPPRKEIFIFQVTPQFYKSYDWTKITTVVVFGTLDPDMYCYAHSQGVRVVLGASFPVSQLGNETAQNAWVENQLDRARQTYTDGINVDVEDEIATDSPARQQLVELLLKLKLKFREQIGSGTQITFDVAWSPNCIDGRCYDHVGLAQATDFLLVMSYDLRSQVKNGPCTASANSPIKLVEKGLLDFLNLGIGPEKLVLGVPWYGYDYTCVRNQTQGGRGGVKIQWEENEQSEAELCYINLVPFRGVNCSDAAGVQRDYGTLMMLLANNATDGGRHWDEGFKSPFFTYFNASAPAERHQVWYDDPESLRYKFEVAKTLNLRGVGMWNADSLDYSGSPSTKNQTKEMWNAFNYFL